MCSVGKIHPSHNVAGIGIHYIDVVGRTLFPCWNVEQLAIWIDRQPVDTRINRFIPENSFAANVYTINHPDTCIIPVGDIKLAGYGTDGYASNVTHVWNGMNSFNEAMPCINIVDRDRSSIFGGLIDRI